jgi:hypothetical protein
VTSHRGADSGEEYVAGRGAPQILSPSDVAIQIDSESDSDSLNGKSSDNEKASDENREYENRGHDNRDHDDDHVNRPSAPLSFEALIAATAAGFETDEDLSFDETTRDNLIPKELPKTNTFAKLFQGTTANRV